MKNVSDDIRSFLAIAILADGAENLITVADAAYNLACWREEGVELPDNLTAETIAATWNSIILHSNPDAVYMEV